MPVLGEIARGRDVGSSHGYHKVIWHACIDCGAERWVLLRKGTPESSRCYRCSRPYAKRRSNVRKGPEHWNWRGGRSVTKKGYIEVWLAPADPLRPMAGRDGYVYEHRLVVARHLGRCLSRDEEVHHRDGDKHHNELSNLQLLSKSDHAAMHSSDTNALLRRVATLEEMVRLLGGDPHEQQTETT